jgi:hypothetical protein
MSVIVASGRNGDGGSSLPDILASFATKFKESHTFLQKYAARVGRAHAEFRADVMEKRRVTEQERVINMRIVHKSVEEMRDAETRFLNSLLDTIVPDAHASYTTPPATNDDDASP